MSFSSFKPPDRVKNIAMFLLANDFYARVRKKREGERNAGKLEQS
jgi:hypothetical protein